MSSSRMKELTSRTNPNKILNKTLQKNHKMHQKMRMRRRHLKMNQQKKLKQKNKQTLLSRELMGLLHSLKKRKIKLLRVSLALYISSPVLNLQSSDSTTMPLYFRTQKPSQKVPIHHLLLQLRKQRAKLLNKKSKM